MEKIKEILNWYLLSGVDETCGNIPHDRFSPKEERTILFQQMPTPSVTANPVELKETPSDNLLHSAFSKAAQANSLEELKTALDSFNDCSLKKTAKHTVFGQGSAHADVMIIGEAPGADEDRMGIPFVGASGQLLEKIMLSVGLSRQTNCYISNIIPWRPPGNRKPSNIEIALCLPFIQRHIEIISPKIIIALGSTALISLISSADSIGRARGNWYKYQTPKLSAPIPLMPTYHPAFLLRTPAQKKQSWKDFLMVQEKLKQFRNNS